MLLYFKLQLYIFTLDKNLEFSGNKIITNLKVDFVSHPRH